MVSKGKLTFVFIVILCVWLFSYIMHQVELNSSLDISNLHSENIRSIEIHDKGVFGSDSVKISDLEELESLTNIIFLSKKVDFDEVNTKANQGRFEITLNMLKDKKLTIDVINTSFSGGVVRSGHYYYRNDSLLMTVKKSFKSK